MSNLYAIGGFVASDLDILDLDGKSLTAFRDFTFCMLYLFIKFFFYKFIFNSFLVLGQNTHGLIGSISKFTYRSTPGDKKTMLQFCPDSKIFVPKW